jgi:hypothetical protein
MLAPITNQENQTHTLDNGVILESYISKTPWYEGTRMYRLVSMPFHLNDRVTIGKGKTYYRVVTIFDNGVGLQSTTSNRMPYFHLQDLERLKLVR